MSAGEKLQLLCFRVGGRTFAIDLMGIREILRNQRVTPIPHTPPQIAGVLNLRGDLISVVDMRHLLFDEPSPATLEDPKLIVVHARGMVGGLLVDQVLDVVSVRLDSLTPVPASGPGGRAVMAAFRREGGGGSEIVVLVRLGVLVEAGPQIVLQEECSS